MLARASRLRAAAQGIPLGLRVLSGMSFVNDLSTTYSRGSSAFHPVTGATAGSNVRRRRTWRVAGRDFSLDLNEQNRTNIALYGNALGTAPWTVANLSTVTQDQTDAYGNANTAWRLTDTTDGSPTPHVIYQQIAKAASSLPYTAQCEFKILTANTRFKLQMDIVAAVAGVRMIMDENGTIITQEAFGAGWTLTKAIIQPLGNGWFRAILSGTSDANTNIRHRPTICDQTTNETYQGASSRAVAIARCQMEQAVHGSSYISTTSASASRAVEGGAWTMAHTIDQAGTLLAIAVPFMWGDNHVQATSFYTLARSGTDVHGIYSVSNGASRTAQGFSKDAAATRTAQYLAGSALYASDTPVVQVARRTPASVDLLHNGAQVATAALASAPWTSFNTVGIGATPAATSPFHGWAGIWTLDRALSDSEIAAVSATLRGGAWV